MQHEHCGQGDGSTQRHIVFGHQKHFTNADTQRCKPHRNNRNAWISLYCNMWHRWLCDRANYSQSLGFFTIFFFYTDLRTRSLWTTNVESRPSILFPNPVKRTRLTHFVSQSQRTHGQWLGTFDTGYIFSFCCVKFV